MIRAVLVLLVVGACAPACTSVRTNVEEIRAPKEVVQSSMRFTKEYVLFAGDQIEVAVWRFPEVSRTVTVRGDGMIALPLLQDVPAAGSTSRELAERVRKLYAGRLVDPEVTVIPVQVRQPMVYVLGDVRNPSAVPYRNAATLIQAISAAGGFLRSGAEKDVTIIRLSADGFLRATPVDSPARGQPGPYYGFSLLALEPDDVIFVPEHGRSQVVRFLDDIVLKPAQLLVNYKLFQQL